MARKREPKVVGLDPSVTSTGIAFADGSTSVVKNGKVTGDKRLLHLYISTQSAVFMADLVCLEDLPRNAMGAGANGTSQGVVRLVLQQLGVPYVSLPPSVIKKAFTNNGAARKDLMKGAMARHVVVDGLDDNMVDAWAIRECGRFLAGLDHHLVNTEVLAPYITEEMLALREVWA